MQPTRPNGKRPCVDDDDTLQEQPAEDQPSTKKKKSCPRPQWGKEKEQSEPKEKRGRGKGGGGRNAKGGKGRGEKGEEEKGEEAGSSSWINTSDIPFSSSSVSASSSAVAFALHPSSPLREEDATIIQNAVDKSKYESAPEWVVVDAKWQVETWRQTGRRPCLVTPSPSLFSDEKVFAEALASRMLLCDNPTHFDNAKSNLPARRLLYPSECYLYNKQTGIRVCKQCKVRARREAVAQKQKLISKMIFDTAVQFFAVAVEHDPKNKRDVTKELPRLEKDEAYLALASETDPEMILSLSFKDGRYRNCVTPRRDQFASEDQFEFALELMKLNNRRYMSQWVDEHKESENAKARERWKNISKEEKLRRSRLVDKRRKERKERAEAQGDLWCPGGGGHVATEEELRFDPIDDLGIEDYNGTRGCEVRRGICKRHFKLALERIRRHEKTSGRKEKSKQYEMLDRVKAVRRKWKLDNRDWCNYKLRQHRIDDPELRDKLVQKSFEYNKSHRFKIRVSITKWSAAKRGFAYELTPEREAKIFSPDARCYHCDAIDTTALLLGADRLDPHAKAYTDEGVVSCCRPCNMARCSLEVDDFYRACTNVSKYQNEGIPNSKKMVYKIGKTVIRNGLSYTSFKKSVEMKKANLIKKFESLKKMIDVHGRVKFIPFEQHEEMFKRKMAKLEFELTEEDHFKLRHGTCYLCGVWGSLGVDRRDNKKGYLLSNSFPCCSCCNYMKKDMLLDDFVAMCTRVALKQGINAS